MLLLLWFPYFLLLSYSTTIATEKANKLSDLIDKQQYLRVIICNSEQLSQQKLLLFQPISIDVPYGVLTLSARVYLDNNEMKRKFSLVFGPPLDRFCQRSFTEKRKHLLFSGYGGQRWQRLQCTGGKPAKKKTII